MASIFESNATELERLIQRVHETLRHRDEGPAQNTAWKQACSAFHASYDELAFPGGLNAEFALLDKGDATAIEMAVRFLEADPRYFRSGYHKEDILRRLRTLPLSDDQLARLRTLILARVQGRPTREMRAFSRLAPRVTDKDFEAELMRIANTGKRTASRHAQWAIQCLKSSHKSRR